jgi:hypothetical protein
MISDWSGISLEYAFTFERTVIFIDVPKKILNPNWSDIKIEPIEISIRDEIGHIVTPNNLEEILDLIRILDKNNGYIYFNVDDAAVHLFEINRMKNELKYSVAMENDSMDMIKILLFILLCFYL